MNVYVYVPAIDKPMIIVNARRNGDNYDVEKVGSVPSTKIAIFLTNKIEGDIVYVFYPKNNKIEAAVLNTEINENKCDVKMYSDNKVIAVHTWISVTDFRRMFPLEPKDVTEQSVPFTQKEEKYRADAAAAAAASGAPVPPVPPAKAAVKAGPTADPATAAAPPVPPAKAAAGPPPPPPAPPTGAVQAPPVKAAAKEATTVPAPAPAAAKGEAAPTAAEKVADPAAASGATSGPSVPTADPAAPAKVAAEVKTEAAAPEAEVKAAAASEAEVKAAAPTADQSASGPTADQSASGPTAAPTAAKGEAGPTAAKGEAGPAAPEAAATDLTLEAARKVGEAQVKESKKVYLLFTDEQNGFTFKQGDDVVCLGRSQGKIDTIEGSDYKVRSINGVFTPLSSSKLIGLPHRTYYPGEKVITTKQLHSIAPVEFVEATVIGGPYYDNYYNVKDENSNEQFRKYLRSKKDDEKLDKLPFSSQTCEDIQQQIKIEVESLEFINGWKFHENEMVTDIDSGMDATIIKINADNYDIETSLGKKKAPSTQLLGKPKKKYFPEEKVMTLYNGQFILATVNLEKPNSIYSVTYKKDTFDVPRLRTPYPEELLEAEAKVDAKVEADAKEDAEAKVEAEAKAATKVEAKEDAKAEAKVDAKVDAKSEAKEDASTIDFKQNDVLKNDKSSNNPFVHNGWSFERGQQVIFVNSTYPSGFAVATIEEVNQQNVKIKVHADAAKGIQEGTLDVDPASLMGKAMRKFYPGEEVEILYNPSNLHATIVNGLVSTYKDETYTLLIDRGTIHGNYFRLRKPQLNEWVYGKLFEKDPYTYGQLVQIDNGYFIKVDEQTYQGSLFDVKTSYLTALDVNDRVFAIYPSNIALPGVITKVLVNGKYTVQFDNGEVMDTYVIAVSTLLPVVITKEAKTAKQGPDSPPPLGLIELHAKSYKQPTKEIKNGLDFLEGSNVVYVKKKVRGTVVSKTDGKYTINADGKEYVGIPSNDLISISGRPYKTDEDVIVLTSTCELKNAKVVLHKGYSIEVQLEDGTEQNVYYVRSANGETKEVVKFAFEPNVKSTAAGPVAGPATDKVKSKVASQASSTVASEDEGEDASEGDGEGDGQDASEGEGDGEGDGENEGDGEGNGDGEGDGEGNGAILVDDSLFTPFEKGQIYYVQIQPYIEDAVLTSFIVAILTYLGDSHKGHLFKDTSNSLRLFSNSQILEYTRIEK